MELGGITPILATISEGILLADAQRRITYVNQAYSEITGFAATDLLGKSCSVVQGPETSQDTILQIRSALDAGQTFSGEILNYTKAGTPFWNDLTITPLLEGGELSGYIGITRDITTNKQAAAEQASRERLYRFLFEHVQAGIVLHRASTEIIYANAMALKLLGLTEDVALGLFHTDEHWEFIREDGSPMTPDAYPVARALSDRAEVKNLVLGLRRCNDHHLVWVMCNAYPNLDEHGEPTEVVVSFTDVTGLKQAEHALQKSEERLSLVLRGANDGAWDWDLLADKLYYSPRWWQMIGYQVDELEADSRLWERLTHPDDTAGVIRTFERALLGTTATYEVEFRLRHRDGHYVPVLSRGFILRDSTGKPLRVSGTNTDLTERKRAEAQIHRLAYYDALTGLPNRRLLMERLASMVRSADEMREQAAMLFVDIDNFKMLNDTLGHEVGDMLLKQVARRVRDCLHKADTLAHLGSDEFAALLEQLGDDPALALGRAEAMARSIREAVAAPYRLGNIDYRCTASIGIALFDVSNPRADTLLKQADLAMYQAKAAGRNTLRVFDSAMQVAVLDRLALEHQLRNDVMAHRLLMYFQPQVDTDGHVTSAEILLRWDHPTRGMISPTDFIPIAEATGLILPLGEWVLQSACEQLIAWQRDPALARLRLSINVSVRELNAPNFVERSLEIIRSSGIDPSRLTIEVTESLFAENIEGVIAKMSQLRAIGVSFSLDDFGTGYSSLNYLQRMPLDEIKIDRSFIVDVTSSDHAATIARMIISLAGNLGISVLAEGVETEAQRAFLHQHGCGKYQGYLFSHAVPLAEFETLVR